MILLTVEEILSIHSKLITKTGGLDGVRDITLLESAVYSAYGGFDEYEQYPSIPEKAARLAFAITNNHAFIDGNKRIGTLTMLMTLRLNEFKLSCSQAELTTLGLSIADGSYQYDDVIRWIQAHIDCSRSI